MAVDGEVSTAKMRHVATVSSLAGNSTVAGQTQDIKSFLEKPYAYRSGVLSVTDTSTTFASIKLFGDILNKAVYKNKTSGHLAFKATVVFTMVINANRFQQGRYIMAWIPSGGSSRTDIWNNMHRHSLIQITQLPHVEIDVNCDTTAILEIPYVNAYPYYSLRSVSDARTHSNNGTLVMMPYSPLVAPAGSTTVGYTLYVSFKDIELVTPTIPQMGRAGVKTIKKTASEEEQKSAGLGPISSMLTKASIAADMLGRIPLLSSFTAPVSWGLDLGSQIASVFGWSRPLNLKETTKVQRSFLEYLTNVDAPEMNKVLGLYSRNEIEHLDGYCGTDIDELSFDYFKSISSFFTQFTWSTSSVATSRLLTIDLDPRTFKTQEAFGASTVLNFTPVAFLAHYFNYYRGGLIFTFKIVKTEFHSGRISFTYVPKDIFATSQPTYTYLDGVYCLREIIDVRMGSEFTINVPYASLTNYKDFTSGLSSFGTLIVEVVDPLVAPDTVSPNVTVLCEVAGAADMEFAYPAPFNPTPVHFLVPQMGDTCEKISKNIGNSSEAILTDFDSKVCIGEKVVSFRSLLKRYYPLGLNSSFTSSSDWSFYPFTAPIAFEDTVIPGGVLQPLVKNDLMGTLQSIFCFSRGSVRIREINPEMSSGLTTMTLVSQNSLSVNSPLLQPSSFNRNTFSNSPLIMTNTQEEGGSMCQVPSYSFLHSRPNAELLTTCQSNVPTRFGVTPNPNVFIHISSPIEIIPRLYRAAGDDFNLGLFVSIPPMFLGSLSNYT